MVKKGFLKKTGCILISASIILTGVTFFGSSTSEADDEEEIITEEQIDESTEENTGNQEQEVVETDPTEAEDVETTTLDVSNLETDALTDLPERNVRMMLGTSLASTNSSDDETEASYSADGTELINVPAGVGESFTVPSTVTKIRADAFSNSNVNTITFAGGGDQITYSNFGAQSNDWPASGTVVYCYGSTEKSSSGVSQFFLNRVTASRKISIFYSESDITPVDPTPDTTVIVNVTETASDSSFEDVTTPYSLKAGSTYVPTPRTGYEVSPASYAVTSEAMQNVTFIYSPSATEEDPLVDVTDEYYDSTGKTKVSSNKDRSRHYKENDIVKPLSISGYTLFEGSEYTVTADKTGQTVTFKYKANGTTPTPSGGGSSGGSSSSSGSSAAKPASSNINAGLKGIYQVTQGANQTITRENGPVKITCNGELSKLTGIFVDNVRIDPSRYTLESGSTILTFTGGFVKLFSIGDHVVRFEYVDGYAETGLKVTEGKTTTTVTYKVSSDGSISTGHTKDTTPKTADGFDDKYLLCIAIFLLGAGAILFGNQRKLEAIVAGEDDDE